MMPTFRPPQLLGAAVFFAIAIPLRAQDVAQQGALKEILAKETFIRPPAAIEKVVTAPWQQNVALSNQSPDHKHFLKLGSEGMPSVGQFGKPHYYLAGLQVEALYGGFAHEPFADDSQEYVFVARRPRVTLLVSAARS